MKTQSRLGFLFAIAAFCAVSLRASDITGTWKAEFDTQIGKQKYIYEFKKDGEVYTGSAKVDIEGSKLNNKLSDISVKNDTVAFVEMSSYDGNDLRITYTGKIADNEMKLTRQVADIATETIVATRTTPSAGAAPENKAK